MDLAGITELLERDKSMDTTMLSKADGRRLIKVHDYLHKLLFDLDLAEMGLNPDIVGLLNALSYWLFRYADIVAARQRNEAVAKETKVEETPVAARPKVEQLTIQPRPFVATAAASSTDDEEDTYDETISFEDIIAQDINVNHCIAKLQPEVDRTLRAIATIKHRMGMHNYLETPAAEIADAVLEFAAQLQPSQGHSPIVTLTTEQQADDLAEFHTMNTESPHVDWLGQIELREDGKSLLVISPAQGGKSKRSVAIHPHGNMIGDQWMWAENILAALYLHQQYYPDAPARVTMEQLFTELDARVDDLKFTQTAHQFWQAHATMNLKDRRAIRARHRLGQVDVAMGMLLKVERWCG